MDVNYLPFERFVFFSIILLCSFDGANSILILMAVAKRATNRTFYEIRSMSVFVREYITRSYTWRWGWQRATCWCLGAALIRPLNYHNRLWNPNSSDSPVSPSLWSSGVLNARVRNFRVIPDRLMQLLCPSLLKRYPTKGNSQYMR